MRAVEASSKNEAVIQQAQNEVRSAQASIKFLEDELAKLQMGGGAGSPRGPPMQPMQGGRGMGMAGGHQHTPSGGSGYGGPMTPTRPQQGMGGGTMSPSPSKNNMGYGGQGGMLGERERPLPPPPAGEDEPRKVEPKNYSQLGMSGSLLPTSCIRDWS